MLGRNEENSVDRLYPIAKFRPRRRRRAYSTAGAGSEGAFLPLMLTGQTVTAGIGTNEFCSPVSRMSHLLTISSFKFQGRIRM